jgi:hypothetical protein
MYIKQEFISDLQRSINEGEYFIDNRALQCAIVYNEQQLLPDHHVILFDGKSVDKIFTVRYFVIKNNNHFTLLAIAFNNKDPLTLEVTELSNFSSYDEAIQRMIEVPIFSIV